MYIDIIKFIIIYIYILYNTKTAKIDRGVSCHAG